MPNAHIALPIYPANSQPISELIPLNRYPLQVITSFFKKIQATVPDMPSWWEKDKDRDGGEGCDNETSDSGGGWGGESGGDSGGDGGGD